MADDVTRGGDEDEEWGGNFISKEAELAESQWMLDSFEGAGILDEAFRMPLPDLDDDE